MSSHYSHPSFAAHSSQYSRNTSAPRTSSKAEHQRADRAPHSSAHDRYDYRPEHHAAFDASITPEQRKRIEEEVKLALAMQRARAQREAEVRIAMGSKAPNAISNPIFQSYQSTSSEDYQSYLAKSCNHDKSNSREKVNFEQYYTQNPTAPPKPISFRKNLRRVATALHPFAEPEVKPTWV